MDTDVCDEELAAFLDEADELMAPPPSTLRLIREQPLEQLLDEILGTNRIAAPQIIPVQKIKPSARKKYLIFAGFFCGIFILGACLGFYGGQRVQEDSMVFIDHKLSEITEAMKRLYSSSNHIDEIIEPLGPIDSLSLEAWM